MLLELFFWLSPIFYTLSYVLLSMGKIKKEKPYFLMNVIGAIAGMAAGYYTNVIQTFWASGIWLIISILALVKIEFQLKFIKKWMFYVIVLIVIIITYIYLNETVENRLLQAMGNSTVVVFSLMYFLFLNEKMAEMEFHFWNMLASIVMLIISYQNDSWAIFTMYVFWSSGALYGLVKTTKRYNKLKKLIFC